MAKFRVPYLKMRDGRPRWEPGPGLRRAGWHGRDLKDTLGHWLDETAAIAAARALNDEIEEWRGAPSEGPVRREPHKHPRSCQALADLFTGGAAPDKASPKWKKLKASTQADYRSKLKVFLNSVIDLDGDGRETTFGEIPLGVIETHHLYTWWEEMHEERGHHMAHGVIAVVRAMMSYARLKGWRRDNPAKGLSLETPPERLAIWRPEQAQIYLEAADALVDEHGHGFQSIGDAFFVGLHTGQRLSDVLLMPDSIFADDRIALTQMKRGALIDTRMTQQMATRVAEIRARRRSAPTPSIAALIINESSGQPYDRFSFNKRFRLVRTEAAKRLPTAARDPRWQGPRVYEIAELRYQDLRDTYVTRSALAGNTAAHIAAVTGHSLATIAVVMKHYLALTRAMADEATDRIEAWLKQEGIAV